MAKTVAAHRVAQRKHAGNTSSDEKKNPDGEEALKVPVLPGPPWPTVISIVVALMTASITVATMLHLGPQYLEPLYGNVLPQVGFMRGAVASAVLGGVLGARYWRRIVAPNRAANLLSIDAKTGRALAATLDIAALLTVLAPVRTAYVLRFSGYLGPVWGPLLTHCTLAFPVFALAGFATTVGALRFTYNPGVPVLQGAMLVYVVGSTAGCAWLLQSVGPLHRGCHGLLLVGAYLAIGALLIKLLAGHQESVDVVSDATTPAAKAQTTTGLSAALLRKLRFVPTAAIAFLAVTTLFGHTRCISRGVINTAPGYTMLAREESVTGWVTVADEDKRPLRLLRSGHSIIGACWRPTEESSFGVFYYADAVRMIRGAARKNERALQIGLGIGVSARSLHEQNVRVDIVEIDPAVHRAAEQFFGLPRNLNGVFLQDGRAFVEDAPAATYDYIVHDVFTGGSVPAALFSQEAIAQLRRILRPDGVLAMNYVGVPNDHKVLSHVVATLRTAFAHVRCFAERGADGKVDADKMTNMMFFASNKPVVFNISPAKLRAVGLHTIRARMLSEMEASEVALDGLPAEGVRPLTDSWNPLTKWQVGTAIEHWHTMRAMFPEEYWLDY
ncbi:hypothetical protein GGI07_004015 [Coemansia sp. Benny D115]|nr:hypothetical protein GGI07_004015 [Coemansia sp. Benny D115]